MDPRFDRRSIRLAGHDYGSAGAYFVTIVVRDRRRLLGSVGLMGVRQTALGRRVLDVWHALPDRFPHVALDAFVVMPDHVHGIVWITDDAHRCPPIVGAALAAARRLEAGLGDDPARGRTGTRPPASNVPYVGAPYAGAPYAGDTRAAGAPYAGDTRAAGPPYAGPDSARAAARAAPTGDPASGRDDQRLARAPLGAIVGAFKSLTTAAYRRGTSSHGSNRLWQRGYFEHVIRTRGALERIREYVRENPARWWARAGRG